MIYTRNCCHKTLPLGLHFAVWHATVVIEFETHPLLAGLDIDYYDTISHRSDDTTSIFHAIIYIRGGSCCCLQIQFTTEILHLIMSKVHLHRTQRKESHTMRTWDKLLVDNVLCLALLAVKNQTTYLCEILK